MADVLLVAAPEINKALPSGPSITAAQTGQAILLPMEYPYTKMEFIAAGGSRKENATENTPASDLAFKIDVSAAIVVAVV